MELIVLGAGPAYTNRPGALGASYLLVHRDHGLLLDLGQGSFPSLANAWEPSRLDAVLVSHLHPDHFIDLVALRHYLRYEFDPPRRVRVLAPEGIDRRVDTLHAQPGFSAAALDIEPLAIGAISVGPFDIEVGRVTHTDSSYAFRVVVDDPPGALVYSGDCGDANDLRSLIRAGDTLLSEVSFGPGPVPVGALHLDGPALGRVAAECRAGMLLLTHLQMGYDADATLESVRERYQGKVGFVWPGDRLVIGDRGDEAG